MLQNMKKTYYKMGVALTLGMMAPGASYAQGTNNFNSIAENINESIASLPSLLSALSYLIGLIFGVLGIMKIKDHVEEPTKTELKDGAVRLAAGGALFALPIIFEAMFETIGSDGTTTSTAELNQLEFH